MDSGGLVAWLGEETGANYRCFGDRGCDFCGCGFLAGGKGAMRILNFDYRNEILRASFWSQGQGVHEDRCKHGRGERHAAQRSARLERFPEVRRTERAARGPG